MFKTLIATCLLTFSCSGGAIKEVPVQEEVTIHKDVRYEVTNNNFLLGAYNWQDSWYDDLHEFFNDASSDDSFSETVDFKQGVNLTCPLNIGDYEMYFLNTITISYDWDDGRFIVFNFNFYPRNSLGTGDDIDMFIAVHDWDTVDTLTDTFGNTDVRKLIVYLDNSVVVPYNFYRFFSMMFTVEDNYYTRSYNGYYTFIDYSAIQNTDVFVYGSMLFQNNIYSTMTNSISASVKMDFRKYNFNDNSYEFVTFSNSSLTTSILMSNCKMVDTVYNGLSAIGVFTYVQPTVQNYTFTELFFGVIDTPIYMLTQLFNFQLFDVNFYIAFMSIVTILIICFVLKKII